MAGVSVTMNDGWEKALEEQIEKSPEWKKIQQQVNDYLKEMFTEVDAQMKGGDADDIYSELTRRAKAEAPDLSAPEVFRETAEKIATGTF